LRTGGGELDRQQPRVMVYRSSTSAMCLRRPPSVIVDSEGPVRAVRDQALHRVSRPDRRWMWQKPRLTRVGVAHRVRRPPEEPYGLWRRAVEHLRAAMAKALADGGLDQPAWYTTSDGGAAEPAAHCGGSARRIRAAVGHSDLLGKIRHSNLNRINWTFGPGCHDVCQA
jgi:hypothetical protein